MGFLKGLCRVFFIYVSLEVKLKPSRPSNCSQPECPKNNDQMKDIKLFYQKRSKLLSVFGYYFMQCITGELEKKLAQQFFKFLIHLNPCHYEPKGLHCSFAKLLILTKLNHCFRGFHRITFFLDTASSSVLLSL